MMDKIQNPSNSEIRMCFVCLFVCLFFLFTISNLSSVLFLGKKQGCNENTKSRNHRKNLFSCNLDVSSEITPVEVSELTKCSGML
jgi:hypothetical protein